MAKRWDRIKAATWLYVRHSCVLCLLSDPSPSFPSFPSSPHSPCPSASTPAWIGRRSTGSSGAWRWWTRMAAWSMAATQSRLFIPASNTKLVVSAVASALLPPDWRVKTSVYGGPVVGGVLLGDLVLYGRGDPTMDQALLRHRLHPGRGMRRRPVCPAAPAGRWDSGARACS